MNPKDISDPKIKSAEPKKKRKVKKLHNTSTSDEEIGEWSKNVCESFYNVV